VIWAISPILAYGTIYGALGNDMKQMAQLICSGSETQVYYTEQHGYDTHSSQKVKQHALLHDFASSIDALLSELKKQNQLDNTLVLVYSEFGRRVQENAEKGTDHGTANNMFLFGGKLNKNGVYNDPPNLANLSENNLKYSIDFRSVYSTVLDQWLGNSNVVGVDYKNQLTNLI